jgi:putative spermidine/putrescine transport system substrate-binding protein
MPNRAMRARLWVAVATACLSVTAAACSTNAGPDHEVDRSKYPASEYPPEIYDNLDGPIVWYDHTGGSVAEALDDTYIADFVELTGVETSREFTDGTDAKFLAAAEQGGTLPWSMVHLSSRGFYEAVNKGYLEPLDPELVPLDQVEPQYVNEYGVGMGIFGEILAWNTDAFPDSGPQPEMIDALLDTENFPGKRCLYQSISGLAEMVLQADGVAKEDVYPIDMDRVFAALESIEDDIIWYQQGDTGVTNLVSGECVMGTLFSGRVYDAVVKNGQPLDATWDGSYTSLSYNAIPKGAPNPKAGAALLSVFVRDVSATREFVQRYPYPMGLKRLPLSEFPEDQRDWLPIGDNAASGVMEDAAYYAEHAQEDNTEFNDWLATR